LVAAGIAIALASPQYLYNQRVYGKAFLDGWYQRPTADTVAVHAERLDLLDRRTAGFFLGLNADLTRYPYVPAGMKPVPRFFPQLIGSAFSDYFHYRFSPAVDGKSSLRRGLGIYRYITAVARASQASGLVIAGVTVVTWFIAVYQTVRRREVARPLTLALPLLGLVGAAYFATQYPYEFEGVIKAHYYHFVTPPLYALYGVGAAWLLRQRFTRILGAGTCVCLIAPAAYSLLCIFR
jgi:hypothetical protein